MNIDSLKDGAVIIIAGVKGKISVSNIGTVLLDIKTGNLIFDREALRVLLEYNDVKSDAQETVERYALNAYNTFDSALKKDSFDDIVYKEEWIKVGWYIYDAIHLSRSDAANYKNLKEAVKNFLDFQDLLRTTYTVYAVDHSEKQLRKVYEKL